MQTTIQEHPSTWRWLLAHPMGAGTIARATGDSERLRHPDQVGVGKPKPLAGLGF